MVEQDGQLGVPGDSPPLPLPARFGRYRLTRLLAVGGMAQIYLAKAFGAEGFVKPLVIKRLNPRLAANTHFTNLFVNEAKLLVSLNHGNIVPVFDFGRIGDELYMAMEYIAGGSVRHLLAALAHGGESLDAQLAAHVAAEVCKGLDYAHRKYDDRGRPAGIIHRDIKPTNVLISLEGEVKIVDFGVAKLAGRAESAGMLTGTLAYMSPEQAERRSVDPRTDVFSTGLVLYEMVVGQRAYSGATPLEMLRQALGGEIPPLPNHVPAELQSIIRKATEPEAVRRYGSAHEMEQALSEYLLLARSAGAVMDSVSPASRLSELMRRLHLDGDDPEEEPPDDGPDELRLVELDSIRMEAESGLSELAGPPDLELIHNAAETFHSEFMTRVLAEGEQALDEEGTRRSWAPLVAALVLLLAAAAVVSAVVLLRRPAGTAAADLGARPPGPGDAAARRGAADQSSAVPMPADASAPDGTAGRRPPPDGGAAAGGDQGRTGRQHGAHRPRRRHGYLNINSVPWSNVTIDGKRLSRPTPILRHRLRAGWHTVVLENRVRGLRKVLRVRIRAGATTWKVIRLGKR